MVGSPFIERMTPYFEKYGLELEVFYGENIPAELDKLSVRDRIQKGILLTPEKTKQEQIDRG